MKHFGEFVREMRLVREMSLRNFCRDACLDASNWSKVERDIASPPKSREILNRIVMTLELKKEEALELYDLAMLDSIPHDLRPSENVLSKLPLFIRTISSKTKPTEGELRKLIQKIIES